MKTKEKTIVSILSLIFIGLIIRLVLFSAEPDEQYAVTLAHKIMQNNILFKDCFELHQTSALLVTIFLKIKSIFIDGTIYDFIYLRMIGLVIQILISIYVYKTSKLYNNQYRSLLIAMLYFIFLPKFSLIPDYGLQQYWFLTIIFCFLLKKEKNTVANIEIVLFGLANCLLLLAYPPFAIISLFVFKYLNKRELKIFLFSYLATIFGIFLITNVSIDIFSINNLFGDTNHQFNILYKLQNEIKNNYIQIIGIIFVLICSYKINKKQKKQNLITWICIVSSCISLYGVFFEQRKTFFESAWALLFIILLFCEKTKKINLYYIASIIPIVQFIVNNQINLQLFRYLIISILILCIIAKDSPYINMIIFTTILISILHIILPTYDFYHPQETFVKVKFPDNKNSTLEGIYIDQDLYLKINEIYHNFSKYKKETGTVLILDSNSSLYDYTLSKINCPDTIDTPCFNKKFIDFYNKNNPPDYVIVFKNKGHVELDEDFYFYIKNNFNQLNNDLNVTYFNKK